MIYSGTYGCHFSYLFVHFVLFSFAFFSLGAFLRNIRSTLESPFKEGRSPLRFPFPAVVLLLDLVHVGQWFLCPLPVLHLLLSSCVELGTLRIAV